MKGIVSNNYTTTCWKVIEPSKNQIISMKKGLNHLEYFLADLGGTPPPISPKQTTVAPKINNIMISSPKIQFSVYISIIFF